MNQKQKNNGQFAVHETQRLKQNTRTLMQALHGCRKNCAECREEEKDWDQEVIHD